jgi:hypothetical protein
MLANKKDPARFLGCTVQGLEIMGHTTTRTLSRYVSNSVEHHRKAVQFVEDRLKKIVG